MILLAIPIIIFFSLEEETPQGSSSDETQNPNSAPSILEKKTWKDLFIEKSGEIAEKVINSPKVSKSIESFSDKLSSAFSKSFTETKKKLPKKV
ncbi:conserved hypothetical protein [Aster yellows witches'-broom phytoplasma AYWB]|uniref:Uncharacterized protein n=1 Tax=Aster yellows witches'-broom phytoplasma (strain AYWB) TaxID=322098 RepID=Q2NJ27_AYWBP|nr:hypothetical protein [Aster yellows witches'-broom phytoplasma]ABC65566.1 conserved hypothetical protein [Aster yellows witches'-broom phytoplasma AYWB]